MADGCPEILAMRRIRILPLTVGAPPSGSGSGGGDTCYRMGHEFDGAVRGLGAVVGQHPGQEFRTAVMESKTRQANWYCCPFKLTIYPKN